MKQAEPLIAILDDWGSVSTCLRRAGAVVVDVDNDDELYRAAKYADGIMLTGGGDVNPSRYGAARHPKVYGVDQSRDRLEFKAVKLARERNIPIMGICRGMQVLNVAHGGTLIQHLDDSPATHQHTGVEHGIKVRLKSALRRAISAGTMQVISLHHQAVSQLGRGLMASAWAHDGTVEALESTPGNRHFVLGVQFHPEMDHDYAPAQSIFDAFAEACKVKAAGRTKSPQSRRKKIHNYKSKGSGWRWNSKPLSHGGVSYSQSSLAQDDRRFLLPTHGDYNLDMGSYMWDDDLEEWAALNNAETKAWESTRSDCMAGPCPYPQDCEDECIKEACAWHHELKRMQQQNPGISDETALAIMDRADYEQWWRESESEEIINLEIERAKRGHHR